MNSHTYEFAPKRTILNQGGTLESGRSVKIWGILVQLSASSIGSSEILSFQSADGGVIYFNVLFTVTETNVRQKFSFSIPWVADRGLKLVGTSGDATEFTALIFHSQPGA